MKVSNNKGETVKKAPTLAEPLTEDNWHTLIPQVVFSSPHIFVRNSSVQIMWLVSACLLPAALWGIWLYRWPAALVLMLSILSCIVTEAMFNLLLSREHHLYRNQNKKIHWTINDGSAILSGLLLGLNLSPLVPWYVPVWGGFFAMAVCKWSFGGLGANWVNPALAGRAFVFFSFGLEMNHWPLPQYILKNNRLYHFDAETAASPLASFRDNVFGDNALENWENMMQLLPNEGLWNLFLGFQSGSIGEVSSLLLVCGGLGLLFLRIISWHIPVAFLGSFALLTWIFGGLHQNLGLFYGEVLFHLFSGGVILGAWFMATDYPGCPKMPLGKVIFGLGCGVLSFLVRFYGAYPEGTMLAILFMNIWTPTLDILIPPRILGTGKKGSQSLQKQSRQAKNILKQPGY